MGAEAVGVLPVSWSGGPTLNPGAPLMQIQVGHALLYGIGIGIFLLELYLQTI